MCYQFYWLCSESLLGFLFILKFPNRHNIYTLRIISSKKKLYCEEENAENKKNPKALWQTLRSLGMPSEEGRQSKILLKENDVVSYNSKK